MLCSADVLTALNIPQCTFYLYMDKIHLMTFLFPLTCKVKKHNYQDHQYIILDVFCFFELESRNYGRKRVCYNGRRYDHYRCRKVMRDTVYLLYSLQNQVQERPFYFIWEFSRTKEHFIRLYRCGELVKSALCFIQGQAQNLAASG